MAWLLVACINKKNSTKPKPKIRDKPSPISQPSLLDADAVRFDFNQDLSLLVMAAGRVQI
jgi:hypothetical protein